MTKKKEVNPTATSSSFKDIDNIMNFIEGKNCDTAKKKADKKARQKLKKEEERRKRDEEEAIRKAAAEKEWKEQQIILQKKQQREEEELNQASRKCSKLKQPSQKLNQSDNNRNNKSKQCPKNENSFEQTIPAMVTIKRSNLNSKSPPTLTITLKGSIFEQDELLLTLVKGDDNSVNVKNGSKENKSLKANNKKNEKEQKKKKNNNISNGANMHIKNNNEIKVNLAVDRSFRDDIAKFKDENKKKKGEILDGANSKTTTRSASANNDEENKNQKTSSASEIKQKKVSQQNQITTITNQVEKELIDIPSLKLPPGITITKVNGPLVNCKSNNVQLNDYTNVPVNKSGVIVVDTEKLIQQQQTSSKKKRSRKRNKKNTAGGVEKDVPKKYNTTCQQPSSSAVQQEPMVTLKNPIFHKLQDISPAVEPTPGIMNINEQATISKGANGMVTIRRPRPIGVGLDSNESPLSDYLMSPTSQNRSNMSGAQLSKTNPLSHQCKPRPSNNQNHLIQENVTSSTLSEERKIIRPPSPRLCSSRSSQSVVFDPNRVGNQNILWGLPGIQITKVNKNGTTNDVVEPFIEQTADVSIIRTGCTIDGGFEWPYAKP